MSLGQASMTAATQNSNGSSARSHGGSEAREESPCSDSLARAILDSINALIALVDHQGVIQTVNHAWIDAAVANSGCVGKLGEGVNYLKVCDMAEGPGAEYAKPFAEGLRRVLRGQSDHYSMEYPCERPDRLYWFSVSVTPLEWNGHRSAVIRHDDITDRKEVEEALSQAHKRLLTLSKTDPLTGLKNRRALDASLARAVRSATCRGLPLSVALLDLDHFKALNDVFGHKAGDEALRDIGALLRDRLRSRDHAGRYGGEEFALILPDTTAEDALAIAERIRRAIEAHAWPQRTVTASFGVATFDEHHQTADALMAAADEALYDAKRQGRNRVRHVRDLEPSDDNERETADAETEFPKRRRPRSKTGAKPAPSRKRRTNAPKAVKRRDRDPG